MSLRTRVLRGGSYLALRQGLGLVISGIGMILLTRIIGPGAFGIYAAALGIYTYLLSLSSWGVNIYLIRREREPQPQDYHQAFSLLLLLSLAGAGLAILLLPFLEGWVRIEGFGPVAMAIFAVLPINLLGLVPLARLERALNYRSVALVELSAQMALYVVALPLAYLGLGPWAPVGGVWAQQLLTLGLLYQMSGYRPQLYWESTRVRAMIRYGLGYSVSEWAWESRSLVNPLVVGRYAGAEAVGYVALAIRVTEQVSYIVLDASWRLSVAVLARLQEDRARLVKAVTEGSNLQVMAVGPFLVGFSLVAPWIVPLLFGPQWLPVLEVYPFIAASYLVMVMLILTSSALHVLRRNWEVAVFNLVHVILFAGAALLLVPRLGFTGYGWAEMVALPSYVVLVIWGLMHIGRVSYVQAGIWFTAWVIPLFSWQLGPWAYICAIVPLIWPATRRELLQTVTMVLRSMRGH